MNKLWAIVPAALLALPAAAASVGVSISIGDPNYYGRIDIGDYPPPRLVYEQPVVIERGLPWAQPVFLRAPPGHIKHWEKHCAQYDACGRPVYFVRDDWYRTVYVPRYRGGDGWRDDDDDDHGHGHGRGRGKGHGKHDD